MTALVSLTALVLTCAPGKLEACQKASTDSARAQVEVCSKLFSDPACRKVFAQQATEADLSALAAACSKPVCQADSDHAYCAGVRGSPADGYDAEARVFAAAIELEHPGHERAARQAVARALERAAGEQNDDRRRTEADQNARTRLSVTVEFRGPSPQSVTFSAGEVSWVGTTSSPEVCADFVTRALGGSSVKSGEVVALRVQRSVSFKHVRCLMTALKTAGFGDADLVFRTPDRK